MIDPENLCPAEVLAHLKHLGYQNISTLQLNGFMHDLRKLIRYEQKSRQVFGDNDINETSVPSSLKQSKGNDCCFENDSNSTDSSELCTNCHETKTGSLFDVISNISCSVNSDFKRKKIQFTQPSTRPQQSFIRPWRLQPLCKGPNSSCSKSDPVQLYHKYKELWMQQKVPGEKTHSQLRWTIREKMLGQDPQPRPISQASTEYRSRSTFCK